MSRRTWPVIGVIVLVVVVVIGVGLAYRGHVAGLGCESGSAMASPAPNSIYPPPPHLSAGHIDFYGAYSPGTKAYSVPVGTTVVVHEPNSHWSEPTSSDQAVLAPGEASYFCDGSSSWTFTARQPGASVLQTETVNLKEAGSLLRVTISVT